MKLIITWDNGDVKKLTLTNSPNKEKFLKELHNLTFHGTTDGGTHFSYNLAKARSLEIEE